VVPSMWSGSSIGVDVSTEWRMGDNAIQVAERLIHECGMNTKSSSTQQVALHLAQSLEFYRDFCCEKLNCPKGFKARIVATRGPMGTKCPSWHIDHVPVRWIQSLVGRGCQFVMTHEGVNWQAIDGGLDDDVDDNDEEGILYSSSSADKRNQALVDDRRANIYHATEQEAVLLVGNRWSEFAKESNSFVSIKPAVHKSPSPIPIWEGRVLLTQDVILEEWEDT
jgi:hypothetical protein